MPRITIPGNDADLRQALEDVNLPTILMVLEHLTGDPRWLSPRYQPAPIVAPEGSLFPDDSGGYSEEIAAEIRAGAFEVLTRVRDEQPALPPPPTLEQMIERMSFSVAEPVGAEFAKMLMEETGFVDRDAQWREPLQAALAGSAVADFSVIVIGAGMSGICAAKKLKDAGIPFTMLDKNPAVGGTWYENTYPDCGVDTPNHFYSYSFERNPNWSGYFSKRDELQAYFEHCTDKFGLRDSLRLSTNVERMRYQSDEHRWYVEVTNAAGRRETLSANAVISAVGQLNRPNMPDIEGLETFAGPLFHSARWRHDVDLAGKRVAVIGTGCSAVQLLPKTAAIAAHVSVFQRTPHWVSPNRDYYRPVEKGLIWALNHIPYYGEWHRARTIFGFADRTWPAVVADPAWPTPERSLNEVNEGLRASLEAYIREQLGNRQDLAPVCTPDFPVFGKRLIVDNNWYPTIARDNVELVTTGIARITPQGVATVDGRLHEVDAIVVATGFKSNLFLWPMEVVGRSGTSLAERWGDYPRAYKGVTVPDYPNLFCLYGPNTNIVHGGGIIYQTECQVHYVMNCLAHMIRERIRAFEVREDVNDAYNEQVQAISRTLAWGHPGVQSWYKNSQGNVVNNSPFSFEAYWQLTHELQPENYLRA
ncbi:MAG: NAD(P)/FAD-dependent oxidoreductase [Pseudomonadales bacterium]|nr:NAD(P)/FAD-dependent oxidoreductase [Pseudomonadales bacterium]